MHQPRPRRSKWVALPVAAALFASTVSAIAADTDNTAPCDPFDEIAKKYGPNLAMIIDEQINGVTGTGLLVDNCSKLVTAGHTLYEDNKRVPRSKLTYASMVDLVHRPLKHSNIIVEGPWKASNSSFVGDYVVVSVAPPGRCASPTMFEHTDSEDLYKFPSGGITGLYILRIKSWREIGHPRYCVQACAFTTPSYGVRYKGAVGHNCKTVGGNSGSPMFIKGKSDIFFVGVHVGFDSEKPGVNLFAPVSRSLFTQARGQKVSK